MSVGSLQRKITLEALFFFFFIIVVSSQSETSEGIRHFQLYNKNGKSKYSMPIDRGRRGERYGNLN